MVLITAQGKPPLFSFGVISDVQYADIPDGCSFLGVPRYYRHSVLVLERAVQKWNSLQNLSFAVNFGDIVDGFCPKDQSLNAVKMIPSHDCSAYNDFSPTPGYRLVVLDGCDISVIGWPQDHPKSVEAVRFLKEKNPNLDKNSPVGLNDLEKRFLMINGAIGREQLEWLDQVLQNATDLKQKVIICCHLPLDPGATTPGALLWNYNEVMDVIRKYKCVTVCLGGHEHRGGYSVDSHGVHHRVVEAALECPPNSDAFGYVDVYDERISLVGTDRMKSTAMVFDS
uniref:Manganese-dependent ADP-ribose/CDP-alcohol diphosphatase n=1 Tax=Chenopodium quinoa TaxID=63459 RepID=A0A803MF77_CHEQI